ncbi:MAG: hypothetical protein MUP64_10635 [Anaerolineae bacterium]|nr:hypothetical protein [Anaerolineae bacterium]
MEFIHSVLAQDEAVVAGSVVTYALPVNPLSHILVTLRFNRTAAAAAAIPAFTNIPDMVPKIEVLFKGSGIFSMSAWDCIACGIYVPHFESWGVNYGGIAVEECSFTFCIPMGRVLFRPSECFPRSTRGELLLQITYAAAFVDITSVEAQIETVELPEADPVQYLKMTTLAATFTATGENDVPLPIGHPISDIVIWGGAHPEAGVTLVTLGFLQVLLDNVRRFYSHTNYETHHNMAGRMRPAPGYWGYHRHYQAAAAALGSPVTAYDHILACYSHLPFDVFGDLSYALQTAGHSDAVLRIGVDAGVAGAGLGVRVIPCEIVPAKG